MGARDNVVSIGLPHADEMLAVLEALRELDDEDVYRLVTIAVSGDELGTAQTFAFGAARDLGDGRWSCTAIDLDGVGAVRIELRRHPQRTGDAVWTARVGHQTVEREAWLQLQVRLDFRKQQAAVEATGGQA